MNLRPESDPETEYVAFDGPRVPRVLGRIIADLKVRKGARNRYSRFPTPLPPLPPPDPFASAWTLMTYDVLVVGPLPEFEPRPRFRPVARVYRRPCFLSRASAQRASAFVKRGSDSST
jgi:hypothetical protein